MDWIAIQHKAAAFLKKYWYTALILLLGMILMLLPDGKKSQTPELPQIVASNSSSDLESSLSALLSKMEGAGKVDVLLTQARGEKSIYQMNETATSGDSSQDIRKETVIISNADRSEAGLIQQVEPPVYLGAVVLCQGADSASVRLAIIQAVANATGLSTDKISVLKMK